jgi:hypothetical protein
MQYPEAKNSYAVVFFRLFSLQWIRQYLGNTIHMDIWLGPYKSV